MLGLLFDLLMWPIEKLFEVAFTRRPETNPSDHPDYKTNVQKLIERNREFEKQE